MSNSNIASHRYFSSIIKGQLPIQIIVQIVIIFKEDIQFPVEDEGFSVSLGQWIWTMSQHSNFINSNQGLTLDKFSQVALFITYVFNRLVLKPLTHFLF